MKAMILAAGKGTRMRPLTDGVPKPLLEVAGQSLLTHHLKSLAKLGIKEVIINTWYLGQQIIDAIGDGAKFGLTIHYLPEQELLDTGGGIVNALPLLGSEPFLVVSADIFTDYAFWPLPKDPAGLAHLVMVDNPSYHAHGDFVLANNKLKLTDGNKFTYGNVGIFRPEFFAGAPLGPFPLGSLLRIHIANDLISGQHYAGSWHNIGTPADLDLVNSIL